METGHVEERGFVFSLEEPLRQLDPFVQEDAGKGIRFDGELFEAVRVGAVLRPGVRWDFGRGRREG